MCLRGVKIGRKCFLFEPLLKRYHTASDDCNALGGVLGSPNTTDENRQLADYIRENAGDDGKSIKFKDESSLFILLSLDSFALEMLV